MFFVDGCASVEIREFKEFKEFREFKEAVGLYFINFSLHSLSSLNNFQLSTFNSIRRLSVDVHNVHTRE